MTTTDDDLKEGRIIRCTYCETPIAELKDGALVVRSKHHGESHVSRLPVPIAPKAP